MTVIEVVTFSCVPNFIKIGSRVRPPDAHNCWMFNAPLLGNGRCHGNCIMAGMSGTWWDVTTQVSSKSVHWWTSYSISNIFKYGGRPPSCIGILQFWTTHEVNYAVRLVCENLVSIRSSPSEILWFYDFASLAEKCLTTPPFWVYWGFESLNIVDCHHNPQKAHPWVRTRHLSDKRLKSVQGCALGAIVRKKYNH